MSLQMDILQRDVQGRGFHQHADISGQRDVTGPHQHQQIHQDLSSQLLQGQLLSPKHSFNDCRCVFRLLLWD